MKLTKSTSSAFGAMFHTLCSYVMVVMLLSSFDSNCQVHAQIFDWLEGLDKGFDGFSWMGGKKRPKDLNLRPDYEHAPFYSGVASGDPLTDAVLIWTRVTQGTLTDYFNDRDENITTIEWALWEMSDAKGSFENPLYHGSHTINGETDWTAHIDVTGLKPNTFYHYQFMEPRSMKKSIIGRTKTFPKDEVDKFSIAVTSCASLWSGYFNYYRHMAQNDNIDVVLHLGDYIYPEIDADEQERVPFGLCEGIDWYPQKPGQFDLAGTSPAENEEPFVAQHISNQKCTKSYNWVFELYYLDPDLRAARARHPFIVMQDSHDYPIPVNNLNNNANKELGFFIEATINWVPQRRKISEKGDVTNWRHFKGIANDMVDIITLDVWTSEQNKDENGILGNEQHEWLREVLENSTSQWRMIGSQKTFMPYVMNPSPWIPIPWELITLPGGKERWESNPEDYLKMFEHFESTGTDNNNMVATGHMHYCLSADVFRFDPYSNEVMFFDYRPGSSNWHRYGTEFNPGSGTRGNFDESLSVIPIPPLNNWILLPILDWYIKRQNKHYTYYSGTEHGYGVATFTRDKVDTVYYHIPKLKITLDGIKKVQQVSMNNQNQWDGKPTISKVKNRRRLQTSIDRSHHRRVRSKLPHQSAHRHNGRATTTTPASGSGRSRKYSQQRARRTVVKREIGWLPWLQKMLWW